MYFLLIPIFFPRGLLAAPRVQSSSAKILAAGPFGRGGFKLKNLPVSQLRSECEGRGINILTAENKKKTQAQLLDTLTGANGVLKGLDVLDGYGGRDTTAYDPGQPLQNLEIGPDSMHALKGLVADMYPTLLSKEEKVYDILFFLAATEQSNYTGAL